MKIITWNVNGLRSVYRKGFLTWLEKIDADIVCLQEIKAQEDQLSNELTKPLNYYGYFSTAEKKGYSGLAVYSKKKPVSVKKTFEYRVFEREGRFLRLDFTGFSLINLYLPHGGRGKEKLPFKLESYDRLIEYLGKLRNRNLILAGDFNIAHTEDDLARPKQNANSIMFTPEERSQLNRLTDLGYVDCFRHFQQGKGHYTWWPFYPKDARKRNLGWRLDYIFASGRLKARLSMCRILTATKGSDHCPVFADIEL